MVKLRLKRCGRKQRATWIEGHDPLWISKSATFFYSYIKIFLYKKRKCSWLDILCSVPNPTLFLGGCNVKNSIGCSSRRKESIYFFFRDKNLGLVRINKLEQLRKYIFDISNWGKNKQFKKRKISWNWKTL